MSAIELLRQASTPAGFVASITERHNYRRVWARDSVVTGLAALTTGDQQLIETFKQSLLTLAKHQGKAGQIPSNVAVETNQVSYGGTAGRVDATLWFLIGVDQYYSYTHDDPTKKQLTPVIERAKQVLLAWEYNQGGLLYVPDTGDWADEYTRGGYVLYDQLLYTRIQPDCIRLIKERYWSEQYWTAMISPFGKSTHFDTFANVLANLFGVSSPDQAESVDAYIATHFAETTHYLLPAFAPVIQPTDPVWSELKQAYQFEFKNKPYHYHNGGLWPMLSGWYVMDLVQRNKMDLAQLYLDGLHKATTEGFPEYIDAQEFKPGGTPQLTWSAAAVILAEAALSNPHATTLTLSL